MCRCIHLLAALLMDSGPKKGVLATKFGCLLFQNAHNTLRTASEKHSIIQLRECHDFVIRMYKQLHLATRLNESVYAAPH